MEVDFFRAIVGVLKSGINRIPTLIFYFIRACACVANLANVKCYYDE